MIVAFAVNLILAFQMYHLKSWQFWSLAIVCLILAPFVFKLR